MRALILSAGRGSRIGDATRDRPKALIEVRGRTLLERQIRCLRAAGAAEVGCVAGWHAEAFAGFQNLDRLFINPNWSRTSMVESLMTAEKWLVDDVCLVSYGDIVYSSRDARALAEIDADLAIAQDPQWLSAWSRRFVEPLDDAETFATDEAGWVTDIGRRPRDLTEVQGQYVGLIRFTPHGWRIASDVARTGPRDMTGLLGRLVDTEAIPVRSVALQDPWWEFDHPADLDLGVEAVTLLDQLDAIRPPDDSTSAEGE